MVAGGLAPLSVPTLLSLSIAAIASSSNALLMRLSYLRRYRGVLGSAPRDNGRASAGPRAGRPSARAMPAALMESRPRADSFCEVGPAGGEAAMRWWRLLRRQGVGRRVR